MTKSSGTILDDTKRRPAGLGAGTGPGNRVKVLTVCAAAMLLAACATAPEVRTRTAEQVDLASFHTYAFVPKPGTDTGAYRSLTTQQLERDVGQELQSRGYVPAQAGQQPDLLIDFRVETHDRVQGTVAGPAFGMGWGWGLAPSPWGPGPWGWGGWGGWGGGYYDDVRTITTASLTVDLIDRSDKSVVWSGTAFSEVTRRMLDHPAQSIDEAVHQIFVHFPQLPRH